MRPASIDDLYLHVRLSSLKSRQGRWTWTAKSIDRTSDAGKSAVWTYEPATGTQRLTADGFGAIISPDGDKVAFLRSTDGKPQIFIHDVGTAEARQLTHFPEGVSSIEQWMPKLGLLALCIQGSSGESGSPRRIRHLPYKLDGLGIVEGERSALYKIHPDTGQTAPLLDEADVDIVEAQWAPDGTAIAYVTKCRGPQRHCMELWVRENDLPPRRLAAHLVSIASISWSPQGSKLALAGSGTEGDSVSRLHVLDVDDGDDTSFEDLELAIPTSVQWRDDDSLAVIQAHEGKQRLVAAHSPTDTEVIWQDAHTQAFEMATTEGHFGILAAGLQTGPELWLLDPTTHVPQAVTCFNAWRSERPEYRSERRVFAVPDGNGGEEAVQGWLLTPQGEGPFPLLLDIHGGPHSMVTFEFERYVHWPVLIDKGWAILALDAVGSASYGAEFARRICGRWGEIDLPQWRAAVDQLQQERVATKDVACFGHSYGGYLSAWALTHDMPLISGVVSGAVINLESHTGTSDSGYYVGPYTMCGELPMARERYRALSPISHVENVRSPVLILQGEEDQRCPIGQAEEFFAALVRQGVVESELMVFPGGSHHVSSTGRPSHRQAYYSRMVDWLQGSLSPSR